MIPNATGKLFHCVATLAIILTLSNCSKEADLTTKEINTQHITSGTWKIASVKVDDVDQTPLFKDLQLQFDASSYSTVNGAPVWPASGTWQFTDDTATTIKRSDDVTITVATISESALILQLTWSKTTFESGRSQSISGKHVFTFSK